MVDTNVVIEMFTTFDIENDLKKVSETPTMADLARPELAHRVRSAAGSFILVHHLATNDLVTVMVHSECESKLTEYAPPDTDANLWTGMLIANIMGPALKAIDNTSETAHLRKTEKLDEFDQYTREAALRRNIPLVTRDKRSSRCAREMGVVAQTPEQYLASRGVSSDADELSDAVAWYSSRVKTYLDSRPEHNVGFIPQRLMDPARFFSSLSGILQIK